MKASAASTRSRWSAGHIRLSGSAADLRQNEPIRKAYVGL
jgi:hypothetical protein